MKQFAMITEADARVLEPGSSVRLLPGGHVTPLAQDTLRDRRITVVREGLGSGEDGLAPVADIRRVAVSSDHSGLALKRAVVEHLRGRGLAVADLGTDTPDSVDYPDTAERGAVAVARGEADAAIAAMCPTPTLARYSREHNGANVLALGATLLDFAQALAIVDLWLGTPMTEARYVRRLAKVRAVEQRHAGRGSDSRP